MSKRYLLDHEGSYVEFAWKFTYPNESHKNANCAWNLRKELLSSHEIKVCKIEEIEESGIPKSHSSDCVDYSSKKVGAKVFEGSKGQIVALIHRDIPFCSLMHFSLRKYPNEVIREILSFFSERHPFFPSIFALQFL